MYTSERGKIEEYPRIYDVGWVKMDAFLSYTLHELGHCKAQTFNFQWISFFVSFPAGIFDADKGLESGLSAMS